MPARRYRVELTGPQIEMLIAAAVLLEAEADGALDPVFRPAQMAALDRAVKELARVKDTR